MNKKERPGEGELLHSSAVSTATWQRPRRPRILVVEDTADIRHFLTALLEDQYEVMAAASGETGLQLAWSDRRPEIILLDVMMPYMDGYEVMDRLGATRARPISRLFSSRPCTAWRRSKEAWTLAPPTTSPSRSARPFCWRVSGFTWSAAPTPGA
ncbi:MAG: response regulator transcription factor [Polaromonas sp.]